MTTVDSSAQPGSTARLLFSKVPEVTVFFWIIKVLCTTVGETFADFINGKLGDNLDTTTLVMGVGLAVALVVQFRVRKYVPVVYWVAVVFISVVGTLITDNMVEHFNVSLMTSTIVFAVAMLVAFGVWYLSERTLSIHSIYTYKRETFYWVAILFTFALGTAAGDLIAEKYSLGYFNSVLLFAALIGLVALAHYKLHLNAVLAFWAAYVLTRPLGASIGDLLSQPRAVAADADPGTQAGLGLGTTLTSVIFLIAILAVVLYFTDQQRRHPVVVPVDEI